MLTKRQNLLECIHGGNPDRYVNQYEFIAPLVLSTPLQQAAIGRPLDAEGCGKDDWGVTWKIKDQPGNMPVHDMEHRVVTDITRWKEQVLSPIDKLDDPAIWEGSIESAKAIDRNEQFCCSLVYPGIFERTHHLCELTQTMMNLIDEPDAVKELMDCITEFEMAEAEAICKYVKPDAIFHHDDWGTASSTFMSLGMFDEFLFDRYKKIYGYYKDHGVELIIHHSDSFGATLVPRMIDLGVDIWQGALFENNDIPSLVERFGDKITIMGGIDDHVIDKADWTREEVEANVNKVIDAVGSKTGFIPCLTHGLNFSLNDGVYDAVTAAIDERSKRDFG